MQDIKPNMAPKGIASDQQIAEWKKQYGDTIFSVQKDGHICYVRKRDRTITSFLRNITDPMKWNEELIKYCFIGGSEVFKSIDRRHEEFFLALCDKLIELIDVGEVELKKV